VCGGSPRTISYEVLVSLPHTVRADLIEFD
jgi:hypothetical protein